LQGQHLLRKRRANRLDLVMAKVDEVQEARHRQPKPTPHLAIEEASRHQHIQVASDELAPGHRLFALGSGRDAMAFEDIAHRLVADRITQVV